MTHLRHIHRRRAFTLVELMVVLGIIMLVIGTTVPAMRQFRRAGRGEAAINSISVAVNAARIYNHRIEQSDLDGAGWPGADYSGTAALFTPAGEIRLVVNNQTAIAETGDSIEDAFTNNAYEDINEIDYITIPPSAGVVGVQRVGNTGDPTVDLVLLPPPFAIRFNEFGQISMDQDVIYYDGDGNGTYNTSRDRANAVEPPGGDGTSTYNEYHKEGLWSPNLNSDIQPDQATGRYDLPFEAIEVVNAVIVFNAEDFRHHNLGYDNGHKWFLGASDARPRGKAVNFSPLSGLVITNE